MWSFIKNHYVFSIICVAVIGVFTPRIFLGSVIPTTVSMFWSFIKEHYFLAIICFIFLVLVLVVAGNTFVRIQSKMNPEPCPFTEAGVLDHPLREWFQNSKYVLDRSKITPGMKVLEVGCGCGYYTTRISERLNGEGRLCSLDIQQEMLDLTKEKLKKNPPKTEVELFLGNAYELPFEDETFDLVMFITVLPEVPDQMKALEEAKRVIVKGGRISQSEMIVDPDYPWKSTAMNQMKKAGFKNVKSEGGLMQYTVTGEK